MSEAIEYVQYLAVNEDLAQQPGRLATQVAHAATTMTLHLLLNDRSRQEEVQQWISNGQKKVVLTGAEDELHALRTRGFLSIQDGSSSTDSEEAPLTVVVLPPMKKEQAAAAIDGLFLRIL